MRCYICDKEDDTITMDRKDGRYCPCRTCQAVIFDCIDTYDTEEESENEHDECF